MGRHSRLDEALDEFVVPAPRDGDAPIPGEHARPDVPSDGLFRDLVDFSPDAIYVIAGAGYVYANPSGLELLGASRLEDLQTRPALSFVDDADRVLARQRLASMVELGGRQDYVEEKAVRLDGQVLDIEYAGRGIRWHGRDAALLVVRDIGGRRADEVRLRSAEEKFRAAFENAPTGMAIVDRKGMFLDVNVALARMFNRRVEALQGDKLWNHVDADDRRRVRSEFDRVLTGVIRDVSGTFRYRTGAGAEGWVHASVSAVSDLRTFIVHLVDVTRQKQQEYDLERRANADPLTNLPNRAYVLRRLGSALRSLRDEPGQVHVLFVDLDKFKIVNDRYGHAVGDEVLRAAAGRMKGVLRPADTIGRIGGDEFVVVIRTLPHEAPVEDIALRLRTAVRSPVAVDHGTVVVDASIGQSSTDDPDYPAPRLLGAADADMYRAKQTAARGAAARAAAAKAAATAARAAAAAAEDSSTRQAGLRIVPEAG